MSRQTGINQFKRELEVLIGELTIPFHKKLASHMLKSSANMAEKNSKETGAKPKQQKHSVRRNMQMDIRVRMKTKIKFQNRLLIIRSTIQSQAKDKILSIKKMVSQPDT
jgi:hypothetical protein